MKRSAKKLPRGIRQRADGSYQVHKMIAGVRVWQKFPADTPESVMVKWREDQAKKPAAPVDAPPADSFAADILEFTRRRAAQPTIRVLGQILERWASALGRDRRRDSITSAELEITMQGWQLSGLAGVSVRKRVSTLQSFYRHMNGADGYNPARFAKKPKRPKYSEPRAVAYEVIEQILGALTLTKVRSRDRAPHAGAYRLRVIAYTGIPPGVLGALTSTDVDLAGAIVHLPERLKGDEVEARSIPLTVQGVDAFRDFARVKAWGEYNVGGLNRTWRRAAKRAGIVDSAGRVTTHLYDLRHSFGTMLYRETRDLATVGRFLGHAPGSPYTQRYALGANRDVDRAAAQIASERLAAAIAVERRRRFDTNAAAL